MTVALTDAVVTYWEQQRFDLVSASPRKRRRSLTTHLLTLQTCIFLLASRHGRPRFSNLSTTNLRELVATQRAHTFQCTRGL